MGLEVLKVGQVGWGWGSYGSRAGRMSLEVLKVGQLRW